jgi:hypothetical protein
MHDLQGWEIGLLALAAFVAVTGLVQLMRGRRDKLLAELFQQAEEELRAQQEAEQKAKQKAKEQAKRRAA